MFENRPKGTIPSATTNLVSLQQTSEATKEIVEELAGQRNSVLSAAVTWGDLLDLGLIQPEQLPDRLG